MMSLSKRAAEGNIDTFEPAGPLMIDPLEDAGGVGHEGVAAGAAQIVGGEAFQNLMRHPGGGGQRQLQRGSVGDAGAIEVGRHLPGISARRRI